MNVVVFVECQNNQIRKITSQLVTLGRILATARKGRLIGLVLGESCGEIAEKVATMGVDEVVAVEHPGLAGYLAEPYLHSLCEVLKTQPQSVCLLGNTSIGRDLAPRIAQRLDLPVVSDVVQLVSTEQYPVFTKPLYAGKVFCHVEVLEPGYILTVRANAFPTRGSAERTAAGEATQGVGVPIRSFQLGSEPSSQVKLEEVQKRIVEKVDLTEADIIVSGGMGVKGPEGFEFLKPLVEVLKAALGSSRAAVLAGYIHPSHQVGQTGKTVSPSLYIACGISGAIQHRAGMSTSKCIVAINTDPEAPLFEIADYGIVGDLFEVVPALTEELHQLLHKV
jgi:electron transfer flavoprotein alpha subunit